MGSNPPQGDFRLASVYSLLGGGRDTPGNFGTRIAGLNSTCADSSETELATSRRLG